MKSYIAENRDVLEARHYIRKATTKTYWFDFMHKTLEQKYKGKYSRNFCLVIYGSESEDDAYVMPYSDVEALFSSEYVDNRDRWMGDIRHDIMRLSAHNQSMSVSAYYNAYDLLEEAENGSKHVRERKETIYRVGKSLELTDIQLKIRQFNEQYQTVVPYKRRFVSEQVARPGEITDYLKQFQNYICQICSQAGFIQRNGIPYIETHHITQLHELVTGSYCSDNIVVVCANCHKKLHFASVTYKALDALHVEVNVNGSCHIFTRNLVS